MFSEQVQRSKNILSILYIPIIIEVSFCNTCVFNKTKTNMIEPSFKLFHWELSNVNTLIWMCRSKDKVVLNEHI